MQNMESLRSLDCAVKWGIIEAPDQATAMAVAESPSIEAIAQEFGGVDITFPGTLKGYHIPAPYPISDEGGLAPSEGNQSDGDFHAAFEMDLIPGSLIKYVSLVFNEPSKKLILVRLKDEKQVVVSKSVAPHIVQASCAQAAQRVRSDYWELQKLADFNNDWKQSLEIDGTSKRYAWEGYSPVTRSDWRRFSIDVRLIKIGNELYHLVESLGTTPIQKPMGATMKKVGT